VTEDDACGDLAMSTAPAIIVWSTFQGEDIALESETSFLWAFEYTTDVDGPVDDLTVRYTRCEHPAGSEEACSVVFEDVPVMAACATSLVGKWGLDGSQYQPGVNEYTFTIELLDGCTPIAADEFSFALTWTP
jgi:hypothetical protein